MSLAVFSNTHFAWMFTATISHDAKNTGSAVLIWRSHPSIYVTSGNIPYFMYLARKVSRTRFRTLEELTALIKSWGTGAFLSAAFPRRESLQVLIAPWLQTIFEIWTLSRIDLGVLRLRGVSLNHCTSYLRRHITLCIWFDTQWIARQFKDLFW